MFALLFALGSGQGIFLTTLLLSRKQSRTASRFLAAVMFLMAVDLAMAAYHLAGFESQAPHLIGSDFAISFLYGPLLYLYVRTLTRPEASVRARDTFHLLPFIGAVLAAAPFYALPAGEKLLILQSGGTLETAGHLGAVAHFKFVSAFIYVTLILRTLHRHRKAMLARPSSLHQADLIWLRNVVRGALALVVITFVTYGLRTGATDFVVGFETGLVYDHVTLLAVTLYVYGIGFLGLRQHDIAASHQIPPVTNGHASNVSPVPRYDRSGLDARKARQGSEDLRALMEREHPYRDGNLTLGDLADMLGMSTHNLTEILSTKIGQTFHDFVNGYRTREVQRRLSDPEDAHLTVIAIAFEAGFNSKSTFNTVFKRQTGMTPSAFRASKTRVTMEEGVRR
jgi:AraC-like DNA-binding protein